MSQIVFEVRESPEGGFEASALGHRIHTQGDTWEELKSMVQDAMRCHFSEETSAPEAKFALFPPLSTQLVPLL